MGDITMQLTVNQVFPAALFLERQGRFQDAELLLRQAYGAVRNDMFLFEAAGILASRGCLDEAREALEEITAGGGNFEPAHKFLEVLRFLESGREVAVVPYRDVEFRFPITGQNWEVEYEWINGRFYEPREIAYLKEHVPPGSALLDIGANVGNHAVFVAKTRPDVQVVVLEPEPRGVEIIKRNVELNQLDNIDTSRLGLAVAATRDPLFLQFRNSISSTRRSQDGLGIEVPAITLEELLSEHTRFVKMDIEGMELEVLAPAVRKLKEFQVSVMLEVLSPNRVQYENFIREKGFRVIHRLPMHAGENIVIAPA